MPVDLQAMERVANVVRALFFDFDGTLTDINQREIEVIHDTVNHFGLRVSKTRVRQLVSQTPSYIDVFKRLGVELTETAINYWTSAFVERYHLSVLRRGVESTLKALSEKYTLVCVTSRATLAEVIQELRFLRIDGLFKHVVTRDVAAKHLGVTSIPFFPFHEQRRKLYECALAIVNCGPKSVVVVGDMGRELGPAKELGITTIGLVTYEARKNELREKSDFLISGLTQLQNVLHELDEEQLAPR